MVLDGVGEDVGEHLLDPHDVPIDPRRFGGDVDVPIQPGIGGERRGCSEDDLGQVEWLSSQPDLSGVHALDVEQIIDQMCDVVDLPRDHGVRAGFRLARGVRHLEHLGGSADRSQRIAQLVAQQCQELVFDAALVLGTVALGMGFEELRHIRHDQVPAIALGRPRRGERQTHLEGG